MCTDLVIRGHGVDANDVEDSISEPSGEGIADIYAALVSIIKVTACDYHSFTDYVYVFKRMNDGCIGRGFYLSGEGCTGNLCIIC